MSRPLKHFGASGSGLRCSHGSDLDTRIARPKQPKTALPPSLRRKMGLAPRKEEDEAASEAIYKAGAGVLKPTGSAPDGTYLKRNSGVPARVRAGSALAQRSGYASNARATVRRPALADGKNIGEDLRCVQPRPPTETEGGRDGLRERRAPRPTRRTRPTTRFSDS